MYEEMTFENIMNQMLEEIPDGYSKDEGSLIYNAISLMAARLEEAYENLEEVNANMMVDTQDLEHLIASGAEAGVPIKEATCATFKAKFNIAVEIGDAFQHSTEEYTYIVTDILDETQHIYELECDDEGAAPNSSLGDIEPVEYMPGFEEGSLIAVLTPGEDQEDEEVYRYRRMNYFASRPFAGNQAYYKQVMQELDGVGDVKAYRVTGSEDYNVLIVFTADGDDPIPTSDLIAEVQESVDPTQDGTGVGAAPIGALVKVEGVTAAAVTMSLSVALEDGYALSDIQTQAEDAVKEYFSEIASTWGDVDAVEIFKAKIESLVFDLSGVKDAYDLTWSINGETDAHRSHVFGSAELPQLGGITCQNG
ncbi:MAG: baseplate J/gp47 family protein [Eubacteriales bacterium]|nr:baseplate J/gp47 family protein [Eubacteriales bacterium]